MKKKNKFFKIFVSVLALLLVLTACGSTADPKDTTAAPGGDTPPSVEDLPISVTGEAYPLTVRDFLGDETVLEKKPERVAVLSGAPLNIWYEVGGKSVCNSTISSNLKVVK